MVVVVIGGIDVVVGGNSDVVTGAVVKIWGVDVAGVVEVVVGSGISILNSAFRSPLKSPLPITSKRAEPSPAWLFFASYHNMRLPSWSRYSSSLFL